MIRVGKLFARGRRRGAIAGAASREFRICVHRGSAHWWPVDCSEELKRVGEETHEGRDKAGLRIGYEGGK